MWLSWCYHCHRAVAQWNTRVLNSHSLYSLNIHVMHTGCLFFVNSRNGWVIVANSVMNRWLKFARQSSDLTSLAFFGAAALWIASPLLESGGLCLHSCMIASLMMFSPRSIAMLSRLSTVLFFTAIIFHARKQMVAFGAFFFSAENISITSSASMLFERADRVSSANSAVTSMAKYFLYCRWRTVTVAVITAAIISPIPSVASYEATLHVVRIQERLEATWIALSILVSQLVQL